jgi:hypothetical protein
MIWVVRQFITHQILEVGGERVRFPVRVEVDILRRSEKYLLSPSEKKFFTTKLFC